MGYKLHKINEKTSILFGTLTLYLLVYWTLHPKYSQKAVLFCCLGLLTNFVLSGVCSNEVCGVRWGGWSVTDRWHSPDWITSDRPGPGLRWLSRPIMVWEEDSRAAWCQGYIEGLFNRKKCSRIVKVHIEFPFLSITFCLSLWNIQTLEQVFLANIIWKRQKKAVIIYRY